MAAVCLRLVWPLMALCVRLHATETPRLDLLLPYPHGGHGSSLSLRQIRECQPVAHGNGTHEVVRLNSTQTEPESREFVTDVEKTRWVYGHMTVVPDPLHFLTVLEPGGEGGCSLDRLSTVEETVQSESCVYAQNAGFFQTEKGKCLGNIVSDGRLVRQSSVQNAQFGIRRDGSLVFGYLSEEEVLDQTNPFVQLVSGVIWLLRDGKVYINHSLEAECDKTQETGSLKYFADVISARTAVGHDAQGRVVLVQVDGQTSLRGMSLWELADFLKQNRVINAINLDGGGSSTFVKNGTLSSYPSDHCPDNRWRCARAVSTALCVHRIPRCVPACPQHARCVSGVCECEEGKSGKECDRPACEVERECGRHGVCTQDGCVCDAGWRGHNCSIVCPSGLFGDGCNQTCACVRGTCDPVRGECECPAGFTGDKCQHVCPPGQFGVSCSLRCNCSDSCVCDPQTGNCSLPADQTNGSEQTVERCLANHIFESWRRGAESDLEQRYLSQRSWLIVSVSILLILLSVSLTFHILSFCRSSLSLPSSSADRPYSYVPLKDLGRHSVAVGDERKNGQSDSDSEEEIWTNNSHR